MAAWVGDVGSAIGVLGLARAHERIGSKSRARSRRRARQRRRVGCRRAEGETKSLAAAVICVLDARGLQVANELRQRILACSDPEQLDRGLARAATIDRVDELID